MNVTLVIPVAPSTKLYILPELFVVVGVWNISLRNNTPLPVSIPVVFAPPTVRV